MAKLVIVAVKDSAVGAFAKPVFFPSRGAAVRAFQDEVNRAAQDNQLYQHPEDFELFHLGEYDDELAQFHILVHPMSLARGQDVMANVDRRGGNGISK